MPFRSQAQRRKFYALKREGKMDQETIDEWEAHTPEKLPERLTKKAFWAGFEKRAEALTGGQGFTGVGKGVIGPSANAVQEGRVGNGDAAPMTEKTLLDRERNPRDFGIGIEGPQFRDESNPFIIY